MSDVRLGLIGAGAIGRTYLAAASKTPGAQLAAIADIDQHAAFAAPPVRMHTSVRTMLMREQLDGVIVATPPNTHDAIAKECSAAGVHVLCEKPFALDVPKAQSMVEKARDVRVSISMASKFRFVQDIRVARDLIRSGALGRVQHIDIAFTSFADMTRRWNRLPEISGGGVLIDNGSHAVDIMRNLLGPLTRLRAFALRPLQELDVEDSAVLYVESAEGVTASCDLSWSIDKRQPAFLRIFGSAGAIEIGWQESRLRLGTQRDWTVFGSGYSKLDAFVGVLSNFADVIRGVASSEVSTEEAVASVAAIDAAYASLKLDRWIDLQAEGEPALCIA